MTEKSLPIIFIDPSYEIFYKDRLFDMSNPTLNRDGHLSAFGRLREVLNDRSREIHTADYLLNRLVMAKQSDYYSFGLLRNFQRLVGRDDVCLRAFVIMEPPIVSPKLYRALPELTNRFERVYLHNISGNGYSLNGVDTSKLRKLYWPQPFNDVIDGYWHRAERLRRIVVINGNHIPRSFRNELYSVRIQAMASLAKLGVVDLFGRGWDKWWSHRSMWPPYWRHYKSLMSIYRGPCISKYEVLSQYSFCLCFENMAMNGYVTEKLFDCLYTGTIPLYLGAWDIEVLVPPETYVDCRKFRSWEELSDRVMEMSDSEIAVMREAGRNFIRSEAGLKYFNSLVDIVHSC